MKKLLVLFVCLLAAVPAYAGSGCKEADLIGLGINNVQAEALGCDSYGSALVPDTDDSYDLGSTSYQWQEGYFDGTVAADAVNINTAGNTLPADVGTTQLLYTFGTAAAALAQGVNDANDTHLSFYKSDATDGSADTAADSGDDLGTIDWYGADGDTFALAAQIVGEIDAAAGDGDMPGSIIFLTSADGAETPVARLEIESDGDLVIDATNGGDIILNQNDEGLILGKATVAADVTFAPVYTFGTSGAAFAQGVNDANDTHIAFYKSDATDGTADTAADSGDDLGTIDWYGADGNTFALAARIKGQADTTTGDGDMPGSLIFMTSADAAETPLARVEIESDGDIVLDATNGGDIIQAQNDEGLIIGAASINADAAFGQIYTFGTAAAKFAQGVDDANDTHVAFYKSDATDGSANTAADASDDLGSIDFYGADGDTFELAARIKGQIDAATGDGDMPGSLIFMTSTDAAATPLARWEIENDGDLVSQATNGGSVILPAGKTLYLQEADGAAACSGTGTFNGAADVTITTSCATTTSRIFFTRTSLDADNTGDAYVKTKGAGSFVVYSEVNDTGTFDWVIFNESP